MRPAMAMPSPLSCPRLLWICERDICPRTTAGMAARIGSNVTERTPRIRLPIALLSVCCGVAGTFSQGETGAAGAEGCGATGAPAPMVGGGGGVFTGAGAGGTSNRVPHWGQNLDPSAILAPHWLQNKVSLRELLKSSF